MTQWSGGGWLLGSPSRVWSGPSPAATAHNRSSSEACGSDSGIAHPATSRRIATTRRVDRSNRQNRVTYT
jgi:hypothetical protein